MPRPHQGRQTKPLGSSDQEKSLSDEAYETLKFVTQKAADFATKIPIAGDVVGFVFSRVEAKETYRKFLPILKVLIKCEGRESQHVTTILDVLTSTAEFGARRANFRRAYVDKKDGWKQLPDDPHKIPYGFW